ncbi:IS1/IS1595 family N-terminal zinc-binding domain-containing protein [Emticicia fluvialis]|uniref:IS1/IS1595 family N-terminal zinc-binding domain-containing protein n=1 Tax=Emticicia fluvialis TaxID=2974474 RepID=UPI0021651FA2|nr:hypothetical protein [Emticicia fluvialis]
MVLPQCPHCDSASISRNGIVKEKQRYKCKACGYNFTLEKKGRNLDGYLVTKALQLYLDGVSFREIERLLGVSHVTVMNWVEKYKIMIPDHPNDYKPTYSVVTHEELLAYYKDKENLKGTGTITTEINDSYLLIRWERSKKTKE